jgi:hypothetical protein
MSILNGVGVGELDKKQRVLDLGSRGSGRRVGETALGAGTRHGLMLRGCGGGWKFWVPPARW